MRAKYRDATSPQKSALNGMPKSSETVVPTSEPAPSLGWSSPDVV